MSHTILIAIDRLINNQRVFIEALFLAKAIALIINHLQSSQVLQVFTLL